MNYYLQLVIFLALASYTFATAIRIGIGTFGWDKYFDFKPFNCKFCLSFWFALVALIICGQRLIDCILYALASTCLCHFMKLYEDRLTKSEIPRE
jgi:hypothetical protein